MGIGFALIIHFIILFVLSAIVGVISSLITLFVSSKEKKKRKILLAAFLPFQGFYTLYFLALIGSGIVSEIKGVDIGIGDAWYVPLNESCQILMIDSPERAYLECGDQTIISDISHINLIGEMVYGKTNNRAFPMPKYQVSIEKFFSFDLVSKDSKVYHSETELTKSENLSQLDMKKTSQFYHDRKWEVSGTATILAGIVSLVITVLIMILTFRLVLYGRKIKK